MTRSSLVLLAAFACWLDAHAADATTPVDAARRNEPFAPTATVRPDTRQPERVETLQEKRFTPDRVEKKTSPLGEQRAPLELKEAEEKKIREKVTRTPEKQEQPKSRYDQQRAAISTRDDQSKPPHVAKYQESLVAASASNMARFPAASVTATGKINRFVFRKNGADLADSAVRAQSTPAGGVPAAGR